MNKTEALAALRKLGTRRTLDGMARYGLEAKQAFGVSMGSLIALQKKVGIDHDLANELWYSGWYEARLFASMIGDPARVTKKEMTAWATEFENWGDCDTVCFKLWDRSPHAWGKAREWAASPREYVKRAGFVLMACLALHDKKTADKPFLAFLTLIEKKGARDERNFVKKGVSWALRGIGGRSIPLSKAAVAVSRRLAEAEEPAPRWVGKDALRALTSPRIKAALTRKAAKTGR